MCFKQCVNGVQMLVESDCPLKECDDDRQPCSDTSGQLIVTPCPPPFGGVLDGAEKEDFHS